MAVPNAGTPSAIRIQYPPATHKRDALTGGGNGQATFQDAISTLMANSVNGPIPQNPDQQLIHFSANPANTCYRNAALGVLLNLKPFINFIRQASDQVIDGQQSLTLLDVIIQRYWDSAKSKDSRFTNTGLALQKWFTPLSHNAIGDLKSWNGRMNDDTTTGQADSVEFLAYVFDRLHTELATQFNYQDAIDGLFRPQFVRRFAYECECDEKLRQPVDQYIDRTTWSVDINATADQTGLADLLGQYVHSTGRRGTCPTCGARDKAIHEYRKLQQLPEVLFVSISYLDPVTNQLDSTATTDMPDQIDLDALQDYPSNSQDGTVYQLQSVIGYSESDQTGVEGHYRVHVRRPNGAWDLVDERSRPTVQSSPTLGLGDGFRPRLLTYVRIRSLQPASVDPNAFQVGRLTGPSPSGKVNVDVSSWTVTKLRNDLKALQLVVGNAGRDKLVQLWNNYHAANQDDKLNFLLKDELTRRAAEASIVLGSKKPNKGDLIKALIAHRQAQPQPQPQPVDIPAVAQFDQQPQTPTFPNTPIGADLTPTIPSPIALARLSAANLSLQSQVDDLRQQVLQWQIAARSAQRRLNASNTVIPLLGDLAPATQGPPTVNNNAATTPPVDGNGQSQASPLQQPSTQRMLKVTVTDVLPPYDDAESWTDCPIYIAIPNYRSDAALVTSQWWKIERYFPDGGQQRDEDIRQRVVLFTTLHSQHDTSATVHQHYIECGVPDDARHPLNPRVIVEILHARASAMAMETPADKVTVIRQPALAMPAQKQIQAPAVTGSGLTASTTQPSTQGGFTRTPTSPAPAPHDDQTVIGDCLDLRVRVEAQANGHGATTAFLRVPIPGYNANTATVSHITVGITPTSGVRPQVQSHESHGDAGTLTTRLRSVFGPVRPRTPSPPALDDSIVNDNAGTGTSKPVGSSVLPQQGSGRRSGDNEVNDEVDDEVHADPDQHRNKRARFHSPTRGDDDDQITFMPDSFTSSPPLMPSMLQQGQQTLSSPLSPLSFSPPPLPLPQPRLQPRPRAQSNANQFSISSWAAGEFGDTNWTSALASKSKATNPGRQDAVPMSVISSMNWRQARNSVPAIASAPAAIRLPGPVPAPVLPVVTAPAPVSVPAQVRIATLAPAQLPTPVPAPASAPVLASASVPVPVPVPASPSASAPGPAPISSPTLPPSVTSFSAAEDPSRRMRLSSSQSPPGSQDSPVYSGTGSTPDTGLSTMLSRIYNQSTPTRGSTSLNLQFVDDGDMGYPPLSSVPSAAPLVNQLISDGIAQANVDRINQVQTINDRGTMPPIGLSDPSPILHADMEVDSQLQNDPNDTAMNYRNGTSDKSDSDPMQDVQLVDSNGLDGLSTSGDIGDDTVMTNMSQLGLRSRTPSPEDQLMDFTVHTGATGTGTAPFADMRHVFDNTAFGDVRMGSSPFPPRILSIEVNNGLGQDLPDYDDILEDAIPIDAGSYPMNTHFNANDGNIVDRNFIDQDVVDVDAVDQLVDSDLIDHNANDADSDSTGSDGSLISSGEAEALADDLPQSSPDAADRLSNEYSRAGSQSPESPLRIPPATMGSHAVSVPNFTSHVPAHLDQEVTQFLDSIDTGARQSDMRPPESPLVLPPASPARSSSAGGLAGMFGPDFAPDNPVRYQSWRDPRLTRRGLGGVDPNADNERVVSGQPISGDVYHNDTDDILGAGAAAANRGSDSDSDGDVQDHRRMQMPEEQADDDVDYGDTTLPDM